MIFNPRSMLPRWLLAISRTNSSLKKSAPVIASPFLKLNRTFRKTLAANCLLTPLKPKAGLNGPPGGFEWATLVTTPLNEKSVEWATRAFRLDGASELFLRLVGSQFLGREEGVHIL